MEPLVKQRGPRLGPGGAPLHRCFQPAGKSAKLNLRIYRVNCLILHCTIIKNRDKRVAASHKSYSSGHKGLENRDDMA